MALSKALSNKRLLTSITPLSAVREHKTIVPPINAAQAIFQREIITSSEKASSVDFFTSPLPAAGSPICSPSPSEISSGKVSKALTWKTVSPVEKLKHRLREIPESSVSFSEFHRICVEACENIEQAADFAKLLDDSGNILVLGNVVFLRPKQVAKSIESVITQTVRFPNDPRRRELEQLEKQKAMIDVKARALVSRELYAGLGFMVLQTLGALRLTFWELSWDVMEPICFL